MSWLKPSDNSHVFERHCKIINGPKINRSCFMYSID